ncbi:MAG: hypothetical protein KDJ40_17535, partial [Hyphomicrobiales bacterium]|nr:hypothetical protein [Hyphomicrobiales bacterium]
QKAAALAAQPKGEYIYPDYPGASQSCVIARDGKWVEGALLVLDTCPGDRSANRFVRVGDAMEIDKADGLCAGVALGAKPLVMLRKCGGPGAAWAASASATASAAVRSANGTCWTIPKMVVDDAKFPFEIFAAPCAKDDKQLKFFFEKS